MSKEEDEPHRVIVIGAGMSGLACARELQGRRYKVLVVEARSRVGGRVWGTPVESISEESCVVDLGGALIHGTHGNPLSQLCVQLGIATSDHLAECLLLDSNGWPVDAKQDEKMSQIFNQSLDYTFEEIEKIKERKKNGGGGETKEEERIEPPAPAPASVESTTVPANEGDNQQQDEEEQEEKDLSNNFGHLFDKIATQQYGTTLVGSALWNWQQANLELSCGTSFDHLGYTWNDDEAYGYEGAHVALKDSWRTVVEAMAEPLNIAYDSPVAEVEIVEDDGTTPPKPKEPKAPDIVLPLSPSRKSRRLQGDSVEVRRSSRTPRQVQAFTVASHAPLSYDDATLDYSSQRQKRKRAKPKVRVTLQNGTILQADSVVCTLPLGVLKTDAVRFIPELPQAKRQAIEQLGCGLLNKCILSFDHVFWQDSDFFGLAGEETPFLILNGHKITGKPILIFMFGGESAFDVDQDWTDADLVVECMAVLRKISKQIPPEPLDYIVTRWGQDAYARMSFSYVPPNVHGSEALATMNEPLLSTLDPRPMVLFAGEHTTPFHPSTIHGAFISGIREAYRLDLALEPRLNSHLAFNPSFLYQKTFSLKKNKDGPGPSQAVLDGAASRTRKEEANQSHGRRQGVMTLRQQKNATAVSTAPTRHSARKAPAPAVEEPIAVEPSRKSARKVKSPVPYRDDEDNGTSHERAGDDPKTNGSSYHNPTAVSQEERTLRRLVHAYPNWQAIQSKVLPLYGGTTKKTSSLKQRYQQIRRSARRSDKSVLTDWKVGQAKPRQPQPDPETAERKSKRKVASRSVLDL